MTQSLQYPNPDILVTPAWLMEQLSQPNVKVLDARPAQEYAAGHIAGATPIPARIFKAENSLEACSPEEFARVAGELGVLPGDMVVAYDGGGTSAARLWWAFCRFGHPQVRYLHGGARQWEAAGYAYSTDPVTVEPTTYTLGDQIPFLECSLREAEASVGREGVQFWDVRSDGEYTGQDARNNPADRAGHIPGAVNMEWTDLTDTSTGLFKSPEEMQRLLSSKGLSPEKEVITYCQGGGRAAHASMALTLMGFKGARNFDGSYGAWASESNGPVER